MENLMALFITLVVIMFVMILLIIGLIISLFVWRDRKTIQQIELEKIKIDSKIKEDEMIKSKNDLEYVKLQIQYEETLKLIKERGVSLAEGVAQTFKEIDKGE